MRTDGHWIDTLRAPLLVSWQLTRDCDLCCLHCCTESAPGKRLHDELDAHEAMRVAAQIVRLGVPYVMLCGGEPLVVPHFMELAETLGGAGIELKIETNGQRLSSATLERLARLPIRSIQVSLDGDTQETYAAQRPGGSLAKAHEACRSVRALALPLEVTFAPTRLNIHEAADVIARARAFGAFRFNTGRLMRIGTAARHWARLEPTAEQYRRLRALLEAQSHEAGMTICHEPFDLTEGVRQSLRTPPATLLILPNGGVKVAAALPHLCADLRSTTLAEAWKGYQEAWHESSVLAAAREAAQDSAKHAAANRWQMLSLVTH